MASKHNEPAQQSQQMDPNAVSLDEALRTAFELIGEQATMDRVRSRREAEEMKASLATLPNEEAVG